MTAKTAKIAAERADVFEGYGMAATEAEPGQRLGTVRCHIHVPFRDSDGRERTRMMLAQVNHCETIGTAATIARNIRMHNPEHHATVRFTVDL